MVQKLSFWLCAILAALVANTYAFRLPNERSHALNKNELNRNVPANWQSGSCISECSKDNTLFTEKNVHFELGKTYQYRVRSSNEARTLFAMPSEEQQIAEQKHAKEHLFGVDATVLVTPVSNCELSMQLKNVRLQFQEEREREQETERRVQELKQQLEKAILFGYQHGIVSDLCVDAQEQSSLAVNIKKSIISALQTTPRMVETENFKVVESDLHGKCETEYSIEKKSSHKFVVEKQKALDKCENTEEPREFVSWKNIVLRKHQETEARCRQVVEHREVKHAQCTSARIFRTGFANMAIELASEIEIELVKVHDVEQERSQVPQQWRRHSPRLMMSLPKYYEEMNFNVERRVEIEDGRTELKQILADICHDIKRHDGRVGIKAPEHVQKLHVVLRDARREDVEFVWKNIVEPKTVCQEHAKKVRDIFVDTAASVMNENVVEIVRDEIYKNLERKESKTAEKRVRYLATLISFAAEPTPRAVRQLVVPELLEKIEDAQIILSFSALVKKAQEHLVEPTYVEAVYETIVRKVVRRVQEEPKKYEVEAVRLMRALENIAPKTRVAGQQELIRIVTDKRMPVSVRASAIKSLQFVELEPQVRHALYKLFAEQSETNEVRTVAYLTLVHNHVTVEELKQILVVVREEERRNVDLFNFVASHQKNLRTTEDIKKRQLLPLNAPLFPEPQAITNFWVSRSYEYTYVDEKTMIGAIVEADVVMEPESRVPRYVTFNLTVPVAEQELPIVALTIRQEGMDKVFAQKLDTLKQFVKKAPAVIVKELIKMAREEHERSLRNAHTEGKWQIFLNVDGKNVFVWDSAENKREQQREMESVFAQLYRRMPIRIDETMVVMPLKHTVRLPTVSGVPVNFEFNTTIVASLETELKGHQTAGHFWEMHFRPTFAVEVGVGLEADVRSVGFEKTKRVQFVNRLYAAPAVHLKTELKPETREMRVKLMMPEQEQTLFRFETEYNNEKDSEIVFEQIPETSLVKRMIKERVQQKRSINWFRDSAKAHEECLPALDKMLGFTVCHQKYAVEDLKAALNTRSAKKIIYQSIVKVVKTDKDMEGWEFAVELPELYRASKVQDELKFKVHFDTPKSAIPRRFTTELMVHLPQNEQDKFEVEIAVDAPLKKWKAAVLVLNKPQHKTLKFEIFAGRQERQFLLEAQTLLVQKSPKHTEAKLVFRFQPRPQIKPVEIEGKFVLNVEHQEKKKFQILLQTEETQIVDLTFVKSGHVFKPVNAKISMVGNVDILGFKVRSNFALTKDHEARVVKTNGQIKYNKNIRNVRATVQELETVNFSAQFTGFGRKAENEEIKKFVHLTVESTQFPRFNHELTYNIQGPSPAEIAQELKFVFGRPEEQQRIRFAHQGRYLSNVRSRDVNRHQTDVELEITPLKFHHEMTFVVDKQPEAITFDLKTLNKQTQEVALLAKYTYALVQRQPLLLKASGEVKYGKYVFLYKDTVKEVAKNTFEGEIFVELPHKSNSEIVPKKVNMKYVIALHEQPRNRIEMIEREQSPILYNIVRFLNKVQKFEHDLKIECNEHGLIRHTGLFEYEHENKVVYKAELEHNNKPIYRIVAHGYEQGVKVEFEAPRLRQHREVKIATEFQRKNTAVQSIVKIETDKFQTESRTVVDFVEKHFEHFSILKEHEKVVYQFNGKYQPKALKLEIVSPVFKTEIAAEHLIDSIRAFPKRQQTREGMLKVVIELPKRDFQTQTQIRLTPHQHGVVVAHETLKNQRAIVRGDLKVLPKEKVLNVEFGKSNIYRAELVKPENQVYELKSELRMEKVQLNHKAALVWKWTPAYNKDFVESFELIKFEMLNHLNEKVVFDAKYVKATEEQYRHLFVVSTRKTHVELRLPAFEQTQKNVQALLVVKTKRFGGVEHKTELKQFNKDKRQLVIVSTTERNGEQLLEVVADVVLRMHEESHLKVKILNGKHAVKVDILPLRWFNVEANFGKNWTHELKFDRKEQSKRWSVVANTLNKKEQEKYFVRFEHQCDEFSNMLIELPMLKGNVELRLDTHQAHFELRGDKQLKKWRHEGRIQWNKQEKELIVKSNTLKHDQEYIVLDAELSLRRPSTLKIVAAPLESRLIAKFDKREGAKLEIVYKQWKHTAEAKKTQEAVREFQVRVESTKDEKVIIRVQATIQPTRKVELKVESNTHRLPVDFVAKYDKEERELFAEWTNKKTDRVVKVDVQLKELENVRIEFSWDAKRDTTKKVALHIQIQKPETDRQRFVAVVRGAIVFLPFELKVDMPRNVDNWFRERHSIVGELKNVKTDDKYVMMYTRKYENNVFDAELLVKKNEFVFVKSAFKVDLAEEYRTVVDIVLRSDLPVDVLNFELNWNRQTSHGQSNTKAVAKYGRHMNKSIRYEAENVAEAVRGSFVFEKDQEHKTFKFEFLKPSSKLQINILNQAGRLLDINVDLAHSLQKKFQITSFIKAIPTVNIETAHGENSRVVIEIINEEEKKVELAFNWFGQWRRNFKLEVIFKFFAQPQIEMSIVSRHPAGVDEVDAIIKVGQNQYAAKYNRKFDNINKNWITKSTLQVNGEKKFEAQVECQVVDQQNDRQMITYKFQLEGVRAATGHVDIYIRKVSAERFLPVESVEFELFNRNSKKLVGLELFFQQRVADMEKTGLKLTGYGQTVFGLVHMINTERRADKRVSMVTLELPEEIEYVLRNEIQYERNHIAVIRSELKKKNVSKPIYQTRIVFEHDQEADMKVMKIEFINTEETEKPKLFVVRYNFAPKHCKVEEVEKRVDGLNKCYQIEVLAGDRQRMTEQNQYALRIATQFFKYPIDSRHFNRTFSFALETVPEFETLREEQHIVKPINFTMVGHVSRKAVGMKWFNINRHGLHKSGLVYADVKPYQSQDNMVNVYYMINGQKPTGFDMHFSPEHFFSTFTFNAKWNKDLIRRWIVGELPELNEMLHKPSKIGQLKQRLVREIREETEHKMMHLKKNYNNELVKPIADEWIQVQRQLVQSEAEVAKIIAKIYKIVIERVKVVAVRLMEETHATYDDVMTQIVGTFDQIKRDIVELLKKNCQKTDVCRRAVEQIEEFELEHLFKGDFGKKLQKTLKKIQKALPEDMEDTVRQIAREVRAMHPESFQDEEEYKNEKVANKWLADDEDVQAVRRFYRHGARLLKMVKPEWYETLVKHAKKIARDVEQNKPIDMGEMRGKMHDLVVDMFDSLEQKTEKPVRQGQYQYQNKSTYEKDDEPNTIFSPKRGEFSFLNTQKPVWTRA